MVKKARLQTGIKPPLMLPTPPLPVNKHCSIFCAYCRAACMSWHPLFSIHQWKSVRNGRSYDPVRQCLCCFAPSKSRFFSQDPWDWPEHSIQWKAAFIRRLLKPQMSPRRWNNLLYREEGSFPLCRVAVPNTNCEVGYGNIGQNVDDPMPAWDKEQADLQQIFKHTVVSRCDNKNYFHLRRFFAWRNLS